MKNILILSLLFILVSCGSRKVDTSISKSKIDKIEIDKSKDTTSLSKSNITYDFGLEKLDDFQLKVIPNLKGKDTIREIIYRDKSGNEVKTTTSSLDKLIFSNTGLTKSRLNFAYSTIDSLKSENRNLKTELSKYEKTKTKNTDRKASFWGYFILAIIAFFIGFVFGRKTKI